MGGVVESVGNAAKAVIKDPVKAATGAMKSGMLLGPAGQAMGLLKNGQQVSAGGSGGGGYSAGGVPGMGIARPEYSSMLGADGLLRTPYQLQAQNPVTLNTQGLNAIRSQAMRSGPSAWANMATQKQRLEESNALDQAAKMGQTQGLQAFNNLAMRGGASASARERLMGQASKDAMFARQNVLNQGMNARMGIGLQDETQRMDLLKNLPGMEIQALEPQFRNQQMDIDRNKFNIGLALNDVNQKNQYDLEKYREQMRAAAAGRTADATLAAAPKPGFIGSLFSDIF